MNTFNFKGLIYLREKNQNTNIVQWKKHALGIFVANKSSQAYVFLLEEQKFG